MSKQTKADKQFMLAKLKQDKIVYKTEGILVSLVSLMAMMMLGVSSLDDKFTISSFIYLLIPVTSLGYSMFVGFRNFGHIRKITKMEKKLRSK